MVAVIFVIPTDTPFVKPVEEMVAAAELELVHVIWELMSFVDPSEQFPVAVNCWVEPIVKLGGGFGAIVMEDNVTVVVVVVVVVVVIGATTVRLTDGLVTPERVAVISALPAVMPVAKPAADIVDIPGESLSQVT